MTPSERCAALFLTRPGSLFVWKQNAGPNAPAERAWMISGGDGCVAVCLGSAAGLSIWAWSAMV